LTECLFDGNFAPNNGGAVYVKPVFEGMKDPELIIDSCIFRNNTAPQGGAISVGKFTTIINSTFAQNDATFGGDIYINQPTNNQIKIIGCTFEDNFYYSPNGIYCELGNLFIADSVFRNLYMVMILSWLSCFVLYLHKTEWCLSLGFVILQR